MAFKKREPDSPDKVRPGAIHAFVATPAYDGKVLADYSQSLAESAQVATLMGIGMTCCVMSNGAFIDLARNIFVRLFLEKKECTHLFFIDADLRWEPRAFVGLLRSGKAVSAGAYPKRQTPEEYPMRFVNQTGGTGILMDGDWIMCDRVATGFLCIERSVIEKMVAKASMIRCSDQPDNPRLFYTYMDERDRFVGEDFAWSKDYCEQFGEYIWAWPDFDFTHNKDYKGNWHNFLCKEADRLIKESEEQKGEQSAA